MTARGWRSRPGPKLRSRGRLRHLTRIPGSPPDRAGVAAGDCARCSWCPTRVSVLRDFRSDGGGSLRRPAGHWAPANDGLLALRCGCRSSSELHADGRSPAARWPGCSKFRHDETAILAVCYRRGVPTGLLLHFVLPAPLLRPVHSTPHFDTSTDGDTHANTDPHANADRHVDTDDHSNASVIRRSGNCAELGAIIGRGSGRRSGAGFRGEFDTRNRRSSCLGNACHRPDGDRCRVAAPLAGQPERRRRLQSQRDSACEIGGRSGARMALGLPGRSAGRHLPSSC